MPGADILYLSGGGYLTDLFALAENLLPVWVARHAGVPIATAPIGLGPFRHARSAVVVAAALRETDLRVRDEDSLRFCREHGLDARLEPDDVFRIGELFPDWLARPPRHDGRVRVGLNPNRQAGAPPGASLGPWWAELASSLAAVDGVEVGAFCFHTGEEELSQAVAAFAAAGLDMEQIRAPSLDFRENLRTVGEFDIIISARFHAVVVARVLGLPHVGVASGEYYARKMRAALAPGGAGRMLVDPAVDSPRAVLRFVTEQLEEAAH